MGGEVEHRLHFRHGPAPPQGKGDAVSRVWALSPPRTTDWAAFGRQVSGAWSVARSPPPPPAHGTSAEGARARSHPLPPSGPGVHFGVEGVVSPLNPHGASLSPRGPGRAGGTRVYPPLCGGRVVWCLLKTPTGRPYTPAAQAGPEGLGCIRRCVGGGWCGVSSKPPRGVPIPPRPRQDRRDSGVSAAVWGVGGVVSPPNPHGVSLSPRGPGRTGGTRVYPPLCGGGWCGASAKPPRRGRSGPALWSVLNWAWGKPVTR